MGNFLVSEAVSDFQTSVPRAFVKIHVGRGDEKQASTVHKNIIYLYSKPFLAAFNSNFKEGFIREMKLEDVEPTVYGALANSL